MLMFRDTVAASGQRTSGDKAVQRYLMSIVYQQNHSEAATWTGTADNNAI